MRIQIVPVGPGEKKILHWEGVQPIWAEWYPDGEHILLHASSPPGKPVGAYVTDRSGTPPKLIVASFVGRAGVSPDGQWIVSLRDGKRQLVSTKNGESKELAKLPDNSRPIEWADDADHLFTQKSETNGVSLARVDWKTGKVEPWQTIRPKDQTGLRQMTNPVAITPDGKWMAYAYGNESDQLYVSDGLK